MAKYTVGTQRSGVGEEVVIIGCLFNMRAKIQKIVMNDNG
jgi:hypothetical protein